MRLAATENRFSQKSFMFDQNLHLLTRKSFYILVLPSNNFRSTRKREKHTQPKHKRWTNAATERENDPDTAPIGVDRDRDRALAFVCSDLMIFFGVLFVFWGMNDIMYSFGN